MMTMISGSSRRTHLVGQAQGVLDAEEHDRIFQDVDGHEHEHPVDAPVDLVHVVGVALGPVHNGNVHHLVSAREIAAQQGHQEVVAIGLLVEAPAVPQRNLGSSEATQLPQVKAPGTR